MTTDQLPLTGNPHDPVQRGELIGIGGQYTVHDIGGGRVVKIPNSMDGSRNFVGGWGPHIAEMKNKHRPLAETAYQRNHCVSHVLRLAARYPILYDALARPLAMPGMCFTQDRVQLLRDLIPSATPDEIRAYLDGFADVCQLCWRYGIHDCILFFAVNNAVDAKGNVVLVDFGEVAFDTTLVASYVKRRHWEESSILITGSLPSEYHAYYFQTMKNRLSGDNFELHWAADLDDLDRKVIEKPELRERPGEIPSLVAQILERANLEEGWEVSGVSPEVMDLFREYTWKGSDDGVTPDLSDKLQSYGWTGSGVELQNVLYRAAERCRGSMIQWDDLPQCMQAERQT